MKPSDVPELSGARETKSTCGAPVLRGASARTFSCTSQGQLQHGGRTKGKIGMQSSYPFSFLKGNRDTRSLYDCFYGYLDPFQEKCLCYLSLTFPFPIGEQDAYLSSPKKKETGQENRIPIFPYLSLLAKREPHRRIGSLSLPQKGSRICSLSLPILAFEQNGDRTSQWVSVRSASL